MKRLGILLSGRGSNFLAIADSIAEGKLDAEIAVVISNIAEAQGLEHARARDIPAVAIRSEGLTVLIVEQNIQHVLEVVDRAYLLEVGAIRLAGTSTELKNNEFIRKAYMGL